MVTPSSFDEIDKYTTNIHNHLMSLLPKERTAENLKEIQFNILTLYWLGVQKMPIERGNAGVMLKVLGVYTKLFGLDLPIPKKESSMFDLIALSQPLDKFLETFHKHCDSVDSKGNSFLAFKPTLEETVKYIDSLSP